LRWHYCDIVPIPDDYVIGEYWEDNNWKYSVKLKCAKYFKTVKVFYIGVLVPF
jgi:hypothetical protein